MKRQQLIAVVQRALDEAATPGAAVVLLVDGRPTLQAGIGFRNADQTTVLAADAQFYIYSITKSLIAIATLQLVDRGEVALDDAVQAYLPDLPLDTPVTVRQLLSHSGGLPDYGGMKAYQEAVRQNPGQPWRPEQFLEYTLANGLVYAPGEGWGYSNVGYLMLKLLLERVAKRSLRQVLERQIFAPLKLRHTFVAETLQDAGDLTPGYSTFFSADDSLEDVTATYHPGWVAHGVVVSTARELAKVLAATFNGQLLSPALLKEMLTPVLVPVQHPLFRQPAYGLGVMIDPESAYGVVAGHGGGGPGYSTGALVFPDVAGRQVISVALANRDQPDLGLTIAFSLVGSFAKQFA